MDISVVFPKQKTCDNSPLNVRGNGSPFDMHADISTETEAEDMDIQLILAEGRLKMPMSSTGTARQADIR